MICTKDCEDAEDKYNEEKDSREAWNRSQKCIDLLLNRRHLVHRTKRSQNSESSQCLKTITTSSDWQHTNDTDADNEKIKAIPAFAQVALLSKDESHCYNFNDTLDDKDHGKDKVNLLLDWGPLRFVVRLKPTLVICGGQHKRVEYDSENDEVVEPLPGGDPNENVTKFAIGAKTKERVL